jgi:hypothetical protein
MLEKLRAVLMPSRRGQSFVNDTIIFGVHASGLGDHLAYSALPRIYKMNGAKRVLASLITNFGEPFSRNHEVADLVWRPNPFLDGFTDEPPNVGERVWPLVELFRLAKTSRSPIEAVARVHGLRWGHTERPTR